MDMERANPIFILGIMPRSGTNFLWDLLCLHPDCAPARSPVKEDFFLEASDSLIEFTRTVRGCWDPTWGTFDGALMDSFHRSLGDGLISFLWTDRERRLVSKSPSVNHVDRFFTFFPQARLVILVRDGRSVVQSAMETFGWDFDRVARDWAKAANDIRRFEAQRTEEEDRYLIVRYEDLLQNLEADLVAILRFLDLDETRYDFDAAARLPVRGSSFYFGRDHPSVHWGPVDKGDDFDPRERWRAWSEETHERFEWIAGKELRHFGYQSVAPEVDRPSRIARHHLADWRWATRKLAHATRVKLGTSSRPLRRRLGLAPPTTEPDREAREEAP